MTSYSRARRKRFIQEAEGYLDLLYAMDPKMRGPQSARNQTARNEAARNEAAHDAHANDVKRAGVSNFVTDGLEAQHRYCLATRALEALDRLEPGDCRDGRDDFLRGQALRELDRFCEAIGYLSRAARRDPENVHLFLALAWCHKRQGRLDLAIATLEDALEIEPDRAIVHYNLACYWSLTNNVGLALAHLNRAFELNLGYRELVAKEPDFEPVRRHPEFQALAGIA